MLFRSSQVAIERKTQANDQSKAQFSKGKNAVNPEDAYTADELTEELTRFMRTDTLGNNVIIVDDVSELSELEDIVRGKTNPDAFAWTRKGQAILIASRIPRGQGRALFLHEVGSHLGLQRLLPGRTFNQLVEQVKTWANKIGRAHV